MSQPQTLHSEGFPSEYIPTYSIASAETTKGYVEGSDALSQVLIRLYLTEEGREAFKTATQWAGQQTGPANHIAIVFDGAVLSCPEVSEMIDSDIVEVVGLSDLEEAEDIANKIRYGELPIDVSVISCNVIEAEKLSQSTLNVILVLCTVACIALIVLLGKLKKKKRNCYSNV